MREETLVMASRAPFADSRRRACVTGLRGDNRPEVEQRGLGYYVTGNSRDHLGPDFIALAADRGPEMDQCLARVEPRSAEFIQTSLDNAERRSLPSAVKNEADSARMADEHRNAVGESHGHGRFWQSGQMAIGAGRIAKPAVPAVSVSQDPISVNLERGRKPPGDWRQRLQEVHPTAEYRCGRFFRREVEAPRLTSRGERDEAQLFEPWHLFVWREVH